ncbi:hypothetical protein [Lutibacter sp.]|uniref:hypothetical protein n=1 Tax=Lutibacter sp. TaxID=1925666 RepID=UPI002733E964|nr:hypothetical protein [Lutibacter sp.]MDP3312045.1 hypothetical protein [Lutibacter sp.]
MKKYNLITALGFFLIFQMAQSQITVNLALNSRPQPWLSQWVNPINGQMIITYMKGPVQGEAQVKLRTTLLDESGSVVGASNINASRVYTLREGVNLYTMADALQLQNLVLSGKVQNTLQRTGRLAAGQYQLKVEVMNVSGEVVFARQTHSFFITSYQLPKLMVPADGAELDALVAQSLITFRWTGLVPNTAELPTYRVQVFEILPGQTPMQAFRGNFPILDEPALRGTTQYIWRTSLPMLDDTANQKFIWTVQTLDMEGHPIPTNDMNIQGRSEPAVFTIINQMGAGKQDKTDED